MTREQKIAKAKRMREQGHTYVQIGDRLGSSYSTVYRWLNPEYAQRHRAVVRAYKARNRERMRQYDREYNATHKGECWQCGGPTNRRFDHCRACRSDEADRRARTAERLWAEGLSLREIARELGTTKKTVSSLMNRWRREGYCFPYRYKVRNSRRAAA